MFRKQQEREMLIDTIDNVFESGFSQKEGFSFFFSPFSSSSIAAQQKETKS